MNAPASATTTGKRLAAIDVGSNSVRLLVAEVAADGTYRILDDEKQTTRLARGLAKTGRLDEQAMVQSIEALGRMKTIARGYEAERVEIIATSAVREAANRAGFPPRYSPAASAGSRGHFHHGGRPALLFQRRSTFRLA